MNDQSNLATSLWHVHPTPHLHSPGGSIGLTVWLKFAVPSFGLGSTSLEFGDPI